MRLHVKLAVVAERRGLHLPMQRRALCGASQAVLANRFVVAIAQRVIKWESQSIALIGSLDTGPRHLRSCTQRSDSIIGKCGRIHAVGFVSPWLPFFFRSPRWRLAIISERHGLQYGCRPKRPRLLGLKSVSGLHSPHAVHCFSVAYGSIISVPAIRLDTAASVRCHAQSGAATRLQSMRGSRGREMQN